jgi:hypothetical protein
VNLYCDRRDVAVTLSSVKEIGKDRGGGPARMQGVHRKERENGKGKTPLTHTGPLMEGVENLFSELDRCLPFALNVSPMYGVSRDHTRLSLKILCTTAQVVRVPSRVVTCGAV